MLFVLFLGISFFKENNEFGYVIIVDHSVFVQHNLIMHIALSAEASYLKRK